MVKVIVNIDGGSRGNPGPSGAGFVIRTADDGTSLAEVGVFIGHATNNVAEYSGLVEALKRCQTLGVTDLEVLSDSELLVFQMTGKYRVKNEKLKSLFAQANDLVSNFDRFVIRHVRREENTQADKLANQAMNLKRTVEM